MFITLKITIHSSVVSPIVNIQQNVTCHIHKRGVCTVRCPSPVNFCAGQSSTLRINRAACFFTNRFSQWARQCMSVRWNDYVREVSVDIACPHFRGLKINSLLFGTFGKIWCKHFKKTDSRFSPCHNEDRQTILRTCKNDP
jgi:hypothetical protein